jgi:hypothetical protein
MMSTVKVMVLLFVVLVIAALPVLAFDQMVMPQLFGLRQVYGNAEATAQQVVNR